MAFNLHKIFEFREARDEPKPLLDHLDDLRSMLLRMVITLGVAMVLAFAFRAQILGIVQAPLAGIDPDLVKNLQSLGVPDSITISFRLAFYAGIIIAFPLLLMFLFQFVLPGLTPKERRMLLPAIGVGFALFLGGVAFGYFIVLPQALAFFYKDAESLGWNPTWTVRDYYSFTTQFLIAFGLAFQLPVVVIFFVKLGVLNVATLCAARTHALVVILVFAAIITPTTDVLTLLFMGFPMYFLYEVSILVARVVEHRERKAHEAFMRETAASEEESESSSREALPEHEDESGEQPDEHPETEEYGPRLHEEYDKAGKLIHPKFQGFDEYGHALDEHGNIIEDFDPAIHSTETPSPKTDPEGGTLTPESDQPKTPAGEEPLGDDEPGTTDHGNPEGPGRDPDPDQDPPSGKP